MQIFSLTENNPLKPGTFSVRELTVLSKNNSSGEGLAKAGSCKTSAHAWGIVIHANHAYVADGPGGLQIINVLNPANPRLIGNCETPGYAWGIAVNERYAYVVDWGSGLKIIDISDPA